MPLIQTCSLPNGSDDGSRRCEVAFIEIHPARKCGDHILPIELLPHEEVRSIILAFMKNEVFQSRALPVSVFLLVLGLFSAIAVFRLSTVVNFHWNAHTRISDIVRKSDARVNAEYIKVEEKGRDFERRNVAGIGWVTGMPLHVFFPLINFVIPAGLVVTLRFFLKVFISRFFHNLPRTNHSENNRSQSKQPRRPARSPGRYPRFRGRYRARDRSRLPCPAP